MERSRDVDRDDLSVEPRLDVVHEGDWFAARPGRAAASCANESTSEARIRTITNAPIRMTGTIIAITAIARGIRVRRRWRKSATGEMRNASSQAKKKMRISRK